MIIEKCRFLVMTKFRSSINLFLIHHFSMFRFELFSTGKGKYIDREEKILLCVNILFFKKKLKNIEK